MFFRAGTIGILEELRDNKVKKILENIQGIGRGYCGRKEYKQQVRNGSAIVFVADTFAMLASPSLFLLSLLSSFNNNRTYPNLFSCRPSGHQEGPHPGVAEELQEVPLLPRLAMVKTMDTKFENLTYFGFFFKVMFDCSGTSW